MKTVNPIKDKKLVKEIFKYLKKTNTRNYLLFLIQTTGVLRISDTLKLKVSNIDFVEQKIFLNESKTKKTKEFKLNDKVFSQLKEYIELNKLNNDSVLFKSRIGINKSLKRSGAYKIIKKIQLILQIPLNLATHTFRKTGAYFIYIKNKNIALTMNALNHSSAGETLLYLGITSTELEQEKTDFAI